MNNAALVRPHGSADRALFVAYEPWRTHYDGCAVCNAGSWYAFEDNRCGHGGRLFAAWERVSVSVYRKFTQLDYSESEAR